MTRMPYGLLRGREHLDLGAVAAISEGRAAVALSKGGAPKRYAHVDPNEDAALYADGPGGVLAAVADGHGGADAAELALEYFLAHCASVWTGSEPPCQNEGEWQGLALRAITETNHAILEQALSRNAPPAHSTLSVSLVRFDPLQLWCASIGDSHIFVVAGDEAVELGWSSGPRVGQDPPKAYYLGYALPASEDLDEMSAIRGYALEGADAVVLCTDGLSELGIGVRDPANTVALAIARGRRVAPELRALESAKAIVQAAVDAQRSNGAGDNIACSVLWLGAAS